MQLLSCANLFAIIFDEIKCREVLVVVLIAPKWESVAGMGKLSSQLLADFVTFNGL
jgi:hypothetical protein